MAESIIGWKFPVEIDAQTGKFKTQEGDEDIKEAIKIILTTKKGERMGNPNFGSNLFKFMFTGVNYTELKELEYEITKALNMWEPRIKNLEVEAAPDRGHKGRVIVSVKYRTARMMTPDEMNFVFDVNEGANL